jgi:hypothetical protein
MKRMTYGIAALAVTACLAAAQPVQAGTSVGVHIQIGDPYRGGSLVFHKEPDVVVVPQSRVYYVRDYNYDLYRYGSYWYFIDDGYWYRARSYRGPFVHISSSSVPRSVRYVPVKYRRHWKNGPPSHAVAHGYYKDKDRNSGKHYRDRDRDRDHDRYEKSSKHKGNGNSKKNGKDHGKGNKH